MNNSLTIIDENTACRITIAKIGTHKSSDFSVAKNCDGYQRIGIITQIGDGVVVTNEQFRKLAVSALQPELSRPYLPGAAIHTLSEDLIYLAKTLSLEGRSNDASICANAGALVRVYKASLFILGRQILEINKANGWDCLKPLDWPCHPDEIEKIRKIATLLALIHSEVSEALEGMRAFNKANFQEELADVLIRVLDVATGLGIDMDAEVQAKLEKNKTRGHKHGGKAV